MYYIFFIYLSQQHAVLLGSNFKICNVPIPLRVLSTNIELGRNDPIAIVEREHQADTRCRSVAISIYSEPVYQV
jgi:hypothetical protein